MIKYVTFVTPIQGIIPATQSIRSFFAMRYTMHMRTTKARTIITGIISSAQTPLDAASILALVQIKDSKINRATVFRTLNTLVVEKTITKIDFGDGRARYELASHHHHHLVCTKCSSIEAVDICKAEEVIAQAARSKRFTVTSHKLEYFGICHRCK